MNMFFRVILIAFVFWLGWRLLKKWIAPHRGAAGAPKQIDTMQRCAQCGVYLPKELGVYRGPHFFCSQQHSETHNRDAPKPGE